MYMNKSKKSNDTYIVKKKKKKNVTLNFIKYGGIKC